MYHYHLILALLVAGFLLMGVGFHFRERNFGVRLIAFGVLATLAPIAYGLYVALQLPQ